MIKVILTTQSGRYVELLPEHMPLREVFDQFNTGEAVNAVNGVALYEEDMDKPLREFSRNEEVCISFCAELAEGDNSPAEMTVLNPSQARIHEALLRARQALEEAISMLGTSTDMDVPY